MPAKHIFTEEETQGILDRYQKGESRKSLADSFGVTQKVIDRFLKEKEVPLRNDTRKHFFNEEIFKSIDTAEKAYWIGFITADGYVNEDRGFLRIKLGYVDYDHLAKFARFMSLDPADVIRSEIHNITGNTMWYIDINSRKFVDILVGHGIRQEKSMREKVTHVRDDLIRDYIRGLYDGDGSIRPDGTGVSLNNSVEVLYYVQGVFLFRLRATRLKIMDHCNTWKIEYRSREVVKKILDFLYYENCSVFLDRKHELAERIFAVQRQAYRSL